MDTLIMTYTQFDDTFIIHRVGRPDPSQFQYKIGGEPLPVKTAVKDLGITVDSSLKYAEQ